MSGMAKRNKRIALELADLCKHIAFSSNTNTNSHSTAENPGKTAVIGCTLPCTLSSSIWIRVMEDRMDMLQGTLMSIYVYLINPNYIYTISIQCSCTMQ